MEQWDFEDYVEEIKFQMTEYDDLTEEIILDWEKRARKWVMKHADGKKIIVKSEDDILVMVKDENIMYNIALRFHNAVRKGDTESYWNNFTLLK